MRGGSIRQEFSDHPERWLLPVFRLAFEPGEGNLCQDFGLKQTVSSRADFCWSEMRPIVIIAKDDARSWNLPLPELTAVSP